MASQLLANKRSEAAQNPPLEVQKSLQDWPVLSAASSSPLGANSNGRAAS